MAELRDPLATVEDLSAWLGVDISTNVDRARADRVLAAASTLVRSETGRSWLDEHGNVVSNLPDGVALVTLQVAARGYSNPDAVYRLSIDDYHEGRKVEEAGLYLTASEKKTLADEVDAGTIRGLGVLSTTRLARGGVSGLVPTATPPGEWDWFPWY